MPTRAEVDAKAEAEKSKVKKSASNKSPQLLRGFKDILPVDQKYWEFIRKTADSFANGYGFSRIDPPILEEASLFIRSIGKQTDIVEKEMFSFSDTGQGTVVLRPEATASVVRAYINHGMISLPQPVKLYYWGPMFRRERPQSGRQRQFHQFGFEILGDDNPVIDAQIISITNNFYQQIGLNQISIQVNSIGCPDCRKVYIQELVTYYRSKRKMLCEDCKKRLTKNPLRLLDCKKQSCEVIKAEAPQIIDWIDEECKTHFMKVVEYLDELNISYILNPTLVRGLDYYSKTVFEIWPSDKEEGSQSVLAGGGRYDGLFEVLGGQPTPAAGVAIGIERTILQLKHKEIKVGKGLSPDVFLAQIGDQAKVKSLLLFEQLRKEKIKVAENFAKDSLKAQLELANKLGVRYALILGQKEVMDGTILIRDMESGVQEIIDFNKTVQELKKKISNKF
ncbi:MAG: histidine--tRNA ligase [Parcubacteria group bacterium]|nr:histidine--tRNA ligase [Parcubacteria group bacterium]|tara:strand:- start:4206 stop:5555 length:1350 start_codon:yes stop_codon:yes gene_type:complete